MSKNSWRLGIKGTQDMMDEVQTTLIDFVKKRTADWMQKTWFEGDRAQYLKSCFLEKADYYAIPNPHVTLLYGSDVFFIKGDIESKWTKGVKEFVQFLESIGAPWAYVRVLDDHLTSTWSSIEIGTNCINITYETKGYNIDWGGWDEWYDLDLDDE